MKSKLLVVAMLLSAVARSEPSKLADVARHYQRLEYDQALALLSDIHQSETDAHILAESWLYEGSIDIALGREPAAREAFARALAQTPTIRLPADTSPRIKDVFTRVLEDNAQKLAQRRAARLTVEPIVIPPVALHAIEVHAHAQLSAGMGVRLSVVDRARGADASLPLTRVAADADLFVAQIPAELCQPKSDLALTFTIVDASDPLPVVTVARTVEISPKSAALELESPMRGAALFVDDRLVGTTPLAAPVGVTPGRHRVRLESANNKVAEEIVARSGEITRATLLIADAGPLKLNVARYTLLATGAAFLIAGSALAAQASAAASDLQNASQSQLGLPTTEYADVQGIDRNGRSFAAGSIACFVIGGAAAVAGGLLFVWPRHKHK